MRCNEIYPAAVYDFHHRDPRTKSFEVCSNIMRKWDIVQEEAKKCDLFCANCHRIVEFEGREEEAA